jgi:hypothetical protein
MAMLELRWPKLQNLDLKNSREPIHLALGLELPPEDLLIAVGKAAIAMPVLKSVRVTTAEERYFWAERKVYNKLQRFKRRARAREARKARKARINSAFRLVKSFSNGQYIGPKPRSRTLSQTEYQALLDRIEAEAEVDKYICEGLR